MDMTRFNAYLISIGMTPPLLGRCETIYKFYDNLYPNQLREIFVSEHITEDGTRTYENLWFIADKHVMEAKGFIQRDDFDSTPIKIGYWGLNKVDYDFETTSDKSRLFLRLTMDSAAMVRCDFKASKENCNQLRDVFKKYFLPNVKL